MARNTLHEVVNLKVEALECVRVFKKCVQSKGRRPRAKEFKLEPTESEESINALNRDMRQPVELSGLRRVTEKSNRD